MWSNGAMYRNIGFTYDGNTPPNYWYFERNTYLQTGIKSRVVFQKHKLGQLLEHFNPEISEWENMMNHGYDRYWDCGNERYVMMG
jgi:hypothetical protein